MRKRSLQTHFKQRPGGLSSTCADSSNSSISFDEPGNTGLQRNEPCKHVDCWCCNVSSVAKIITGLLHVRHTHSCHHHIFKHSKCWLSFWKSPASPQEHMTIRYNPQAVSHTWTCRGCWSCWGGTSSNGDARVVRNLTGQGTKCPFHDAFNVVLNVLSCLYTHGLYTHGNSLVGQKKLQPLRTLTFRINNCKKHHDPRLRKKLEKPKSTETKNKKKGKNNWRRTNKNTKDNKN